MLPKSSEKSGMDAGTLGCDGRKSKAGAAGCGVGGGPPKSKGSDEGLGAGSGAGGAPKSKSYEGGTGIGAPPIAASGVSKLKDESPPSGFASKSEENDGAGAGSRGGDGVPRSGAAVGAKATCVGSLQLGSSDSAPEPGRGIAEAAEGVWLPLSAMAGERAGEDGASGGRSIAAVAPPDRGVASDENEPGAALGSGIAPPAAGEDAPRSGMELGASGLGEAPGNGIELSPNGLGEAAGSGIELSPNGLGEAGGSGMELGASGLGEAAGSGMELGASGLGEAAGNGIELSPNDLGEAGGSGMELPPDGFAAPGSGMESPGGLDAPGSSAPGSGIAPDSASAPFGVSPGMIGTSVLHFAHFNFAPPGGTRLSSMLYLVRQDGQVTRMSLQGAEGIRGVGGR
jgi:hypothetical protein